MNGIGIRPINAPRFWGTARRITTVKFMMKKFVRHLAVDSPFSFFTIQRSTGCAMNPKIAELTTPMIAALMIPPSNAEIAAPTPTLISATIVATNVPSAAVKMFAGRA